MSKVSPIKAITGLLHIKNLATKTDKNDAGNHKILLHSKMKIKKKKIK